MSGSLKDSQTKSFNLQSFNVKNLTSTSKANNKSFSGFNKSQNSLLGKGKGLNVLLVIIMSTFSDILIKIGDIVKSTGGMLTSGADGLSIINNKFSQFISMV